MAALAIVNLWSAGVFLTLLGLLQAFSQENTLGGQSMLLAGAASLLASCLCLPSVYYALGRLLSWRTFDLLHALRGFRPSLLIFLFPLVLVLGFAAVRLSGLTWVLLPSIHLLAVGLPVLWFLYVAVRGLPLGSSQRLWGVFDSGLVLGPALILLFEMAALLIFAIIIVFWISSQPELVEQLVYLSEQISRTAPTSEEVLELLTPFLQRPGVILAALAFAAVVVPVIEEICKPIGVWLLAGRGLTPAAGFTAGAMSGAGYALFESLMLSGGGEAWMTIIVGRAGTAVLHIATSSLMGWALVQAWNRSRYAQLGLAYLGAVLVHGLWNALAVATAFTTLSSETPGSWIDPALGRWLEVIAPAGLFLIVILTFIGLIWANHKLAKPALPATPGSTPASGALNLNGEEDHPVIAAG